MYTLRIIEVKPQDKSCDINVKDLTVVHDESHPDFDQALHEQYTSRTHTFPTSACDFLGNMGSECSAWLPGDDTTLTPGLDSILLKPARRRAVSEEPSFGNLNPSKRRRTSSVDNLAENSTAPGWPSQMLQTMQEASEKVNPTPDPTPAPSTFSPPAVDTSMLSPTTLRLLGNRANQVTTPPVPANGEEEDDDLRLTAVVDRLNQAAAKNNMRSRSSRESSVDRSTRSSSREGRVR